MRFNCKINIRPVLLTLVEGLKTKKAKLFNFNMYILFLQGQRSKNRAAKTYFCKVQDTCFIRNNNYTKKNLKYFNNSYVKSLDLSNFMCFLFNLTISTKDIKVWPT